MNKIELLLDYFLGPLVLVAVLLAGLIGINHLLSRFQTARPERTVHRQSIMLVMTLVALVFLIVMLPINETLRGQILSLLGLLLSAAIALSATTFLGNALAGVLLRNVRSFRTGDFIYINEQFGRVSGRGLFHIEIQTADRDLVTLPNLYVTNNPVKVVRSSGTVVSSEVSLGYDVSRSKIEELLLEAAAEAGLEDPFVYIMQLGDFSILYRINGVLTDVKQLLSARSRLNGAILDTLHRADIEIVSPRFMNTRDVGDQTFLSRPVIEENGKQDTKDPEDIIFDKADKAATLEEQKTSLDEIAERIAVLTAARDKASEEKQPKFDLKLERLQEQHEQLTRKIAHDTVTLNGDKPPA